MKTLRWTVLALAAVAALVALAWWAERPSVAKGSTLVIELSGDYVEAPRPPLVGTLFGAGRPSLIQLLSDLRKAERDARLKRVIFVVGDLRIGWAKAQELRDAIQALRDAGRHPTALLEVEGFGANLEYYVASAAEQVYLAPGSGSPLIGLAEEHLFLGELWERLGISMSVAQAGRWKGAADSIVDKQMNQYYREQANRLLDSIDGQFIAGIAQARGVPVETVRKVIDTAPSQPDVLQGLHLIDGVRTRRALLDETDEAHRIDAEQYAAIDPSQVGFAPKATFALIYGSGTIQGGSGTVSRTGQPVFASQTVIDALEQAAKDDSIRAIVLRIDSPGGSAFPSEQVWQAIRHVHQQKPVVASFSDYAASGAYYLSSAADAIVAEPATLTGSIGVFAVRPGFGGLLDRIGIHSEILVRAPNAEINLLTPSLSPETRDWLQSDVDNVYHRFLARVAEGRGRDVSAISDIAEGRVWTGEQAVTRGLVDALGGLRAAVQRAKAKVGIDPAADVALAVYPPPKPLLVQIRDAIHASIARSVSAALPFQPVAARAGAWMEALAGPGPVLAPYFWVDIR
jgi:protease-4